MNPQETTYQPGDRVQFLNETGEATVLENRGDSLLLEDEHGFEVEMLVTEIVARRADLEKAYRAEGISGMNSLKAGSEGQRKTKGQTKADKNLKPFMEGSGKNTYPEIDLHLHEITDMDIRLKNAQLIEIQLSHFRKMLSLTMDAKMRKIVFIHGVGEGVLKAEIRNALDMTTNCTYFDADYQRYGYGATEVNLWYN
jgi:hypothetical protein